MIAIINVVAALVLSDDGKKFMICKRPKHKTRGLLWEFVGGKTEAGETLPEALVRECREELDVTVSVGDIFTEVVHEYPDMTIRLTLFYAKIVSGKPKLLEHEDMRFISPEEIDSFDFCPADYEILDLIKKKFASGEK